MSQFHLHATPEQLARGAVTYEEYCAICHAPDGTGDSGPPLTRRTDETRGALSFAQERLWFLQQMDEGASAYNMATATLIEGPLELDDGEAAAAGGGEHLADDHEDDRQRQALPQAGDYYGRAVNLASRLESSAAPGQILISADTWSLDGVEPRYETLPGWEQDTTGIRRLEDLPVPGFGLSARGLRQHALAVQLG